MSLLSGQAVAVFLDCPKGLLHKGGFSYETTKTEVPCQSRCGTIKIRAQTPSLPSTCVYFVLHLYLCGFQMCELFSSWTENYKQTNRDIHYMVLADVTMQPLTNSNYHCAPRKSLGNYESPFNITKLPYLRYMYFPLYIEYPHGRLELAT